MLKVVQKNEESNDNHAEAVGGSLLDEIVRDGAQQMLAAALQAEVAAYAEARCGERDEVGHRLMVRNGHHAEREVTTAGWRSSRWASVTWCASGPGNASRSTDGWPRATPRLVHQLRR